jgi:hypothetical protein
VAEVGWVSQWSAVVAMWSFWAVRGSGCKCVVVGGGSLSRAGVSGGRLASVVL